MATKLFSIKEILQFQAKSRRKAGEGLENGPYPFFTSSQIQKKWCAEADYQKGSVILGTGGGASVHYSEQFSTSTDVFILAPSTEFISAKYVAYYLLGNKHILDKGFKGAGLKHISRKYVEEIQIPLPINKDGGPDIKEQKRIVNLLEEAEKLQKKRTIADQKMEEMIPALFNEMFGDLATNPKGWQTVSIGSVVDNKRGIKCGPFGSALKRKEYVTSGVPVWGIPNMRPNEFIENGSLFITEDKFNELVSYNVKNGDLLISRAGTVGMVCVANPSEEKSIIGTNLIRVALDTNVIVPEFLSTMINEFKSKSGSMKVDSNEGSYSFISTKGIQKIQIYLPPHSLQIEFAKKVKKITLLKERQKKSVEKINNLFASLLSNSLTK